MMFSNSWFNRGFEFETFRFQNHAKPWVNFENHVS